MLPDRTLATPVSVLLAAAFLVAAAGARADVPAGALPAARPLDVTALTFATPGTRIVLGETAQISLTLQARTADGAPLDVAPPQLTASTGTVSAPVRTGPGVWTATFVPPKEAYPHVAIVLATLETSTMSAVGFIPLHLWGKGQTSVKTKPLSQVTVFIGNESFGPVAADSDGVANVPIVVPPGPERAVARSVDDVGNESQKTIDLGVPSFNRLAMIALDDVAAADGGGEARMLVFAVDRKGDPLYELKLTSRASVGDVDKDPVGLAPGLFRLGYRPGKAPHGTATIDVALDGAPDSKASARVELVTGRPVRASIDTPVASLSADEAREVALEVRLFDQAGNAVPAQAASVDVDWGRIDRIENVGPAGSVVARRVTWVLPALLRAHMEPAATLTVRTPDGAILGTRRIALLAGRPAHLKLDPVEPLTADGESSVELHLRATDAVGNALVPTGAALSVPDGAGQIVAATVDGKLYRARFVPAPRDHAEFVEVKGTMGALTAALPVKLVPRPRARLLVGPGLTAGSNYGALVHAGPDVSLLVRLPGLDGSVHAGLSVSLLQSVQAPTDVDVRAFPVYVEGAWRPLLTQDITAHLGGALGVVLTDEATKDAGGRDVRVVSPGAAAQAVLGIGYRLGPGFLEVDGRVGYGLSFPSGAAGAPLGAGVVLAYRFGI